MTSEEWEDCHVGDVLYNERINQTYVVVDTSMSSEGVLTVSRTINAQNPDEWTRRRKTVDTEELIQLEAEKAAAFVKQSRS